MDLQANSDLQQAQENNYENSTLRQSLTSSKLRFNFSQII